MKIKTFTKTIFFTLFVCSFYTMTSCQNEDIPVTDQKKTEADSLIQVAYKMHDYERLLQLAELHQSRGVISDMKLFYWKGYAYSRMRKMRLAEVEWEKALALEINNKEDLEYYAKSANRLAGLLYIKSNYEGTIRTALTAIKVLREKEYTTNTDFANLQSFTGCCQLKLGRTQEAAENFAEAWQHYLQATENSNDLSTFTGSTIGIVTITDAYVQTNHFKDVFDWTERLNTMLMRYKQQPQSDEVFIDKQWARLHFYKAYALQSTGKTSEANTAYQTALATRYAKTSDGLIEATNYLMKAERWMEAAKNYDVLEKQVDLYDLSTNIDNIMQYMQPKFKANVLANRRDSAITAGIRLCQGLDSAVVRERHDAAIELATIYETQEKETELMEQKASLSQQRFLTTAIALGLVVLGLCLFIYFRHQAAVRLEKAFFELKKSNSNKSESLLKRDEDILMISKKLQEPVTLLSESADMLTTPGLSLDEITADKFHRDIKSNTERILLLINELKELTEQKGQNSQ